VLANPGCTIDLGPTKKAQQSQHHEQRLSWIPAAGCATPVNEANVLESSYTKPAGSLKDLGLLLIDKT
jgi:hypothetical protein